MTDAGSDFFDFFNGFTSFSANSKLEEELDKLYWSDAEYYKYKLGVIKSKGYKVLRNKLGKHQVKLCGG